MWEMLLNHLQSHRCFVLLNWICQCHHQEWNWTNYLSLSLNLAQNQNQWWFIVTEGWSNLVSWFTTCCIFGIIFSCNQCKWLVSQREKRKFGLLSPFWEYASQPYFFGVAKSLTWYGIQVWCNGELDASRTFKLNFVYIFGKNKVSTSWKLDFCESIFLLKQGQKVLCEKNCANKNQNWCTIRACTLTLWTYSNEVKWFCKKDKKIISVLLDNLVHELTAHQKQADALPKKNSDRKLSS